VLEEATSPPEGTITATLQPVITAAIERISRDLVMIPFMKLLPC
jgi:hypothetical protein